MEQPTNTSVLDSFDGRQELYTITAARGALSDEALKEAFAECLKSLHRKFGGDWKDATISLWVSHHPH